MCPQLEILMAGSTVKIFYWQRFFTVRSLVLVRGGSRGLGQRFLGVEQGSFGQKFFSFEDISGLNSEFVR